jgi:hypothetical protein
LNPEGRFLRKIGLPVEAFHLAGAVLVAAGSPGHSGNCGLMASAQIALAFQGRHELPSSGEERAYVALHRALAAYNTPNTLAMDR